MSYPTLCEVVAAQDDLLHHSCFVLSMFFEANILLIEILFSSS